MHANTAILIYAHQLFSAKYYSQTCWIPELKPYLFLKSSSNPFPPRSPLQDFPVIYNSLYKSLMFCTAICEAFVTALSYPIGLQT